MNFLGSSFDVGASEFVPGKFGDIGSVGVKGDNNDPLGLTTVTSMSGLNLAASSWVPSSSTTALDQLGIEESIDSVEGSTFENHVEVIWDGHSYFVPESLTYLAEDGSHVYVGPVEEEGLEWANGSLTLPAPPKRSLQTIGIPEPIRQHFQSLDVEALRQMKPDDERYKEIPLRYHSAYILDTNAAASSSTTGGSFGYPSTVFKVVDRADSQIYALRRFDNVRTSGSIINNALSQWIEVRHPGIVSLYGIYQDKGAVFFSYAYHPAAQTLKQRFIDQRGPLLNEALIWRILVQLTSAIRLVHGRGGAMRVVDPGHVLLTSGTCVRFNCVSIPDIIEFESRKTVVDMQFEDLVKLGRLVLSLCTRVHITPKNQDDALTHIKNQFSAELQRAIQTLLSAKATVTQFCSVIATRIHDELDTALAASDALHSSLRNEYENGRLLRLLLKLGFINERPEYDMAPQWAETGDRYCLKLFRDYAFHQARTNGQPVVDAGHVLTALNKVDTGDTEELLLCSRNQKDLLLVTFADVQRCLEKAFVDLSEQADKGDGAGAGGGSSGSNKDGNGAVFSLAQQQQQQQHRVPTNQHGTYPRGGRGGRGGGNHRSGGGGGGNSHQQNHHQNHHQHHSQQEPSTFGRSMVGMDELDQHRGGSNNNSNANNLGGGGGGGNLYGRGNHHSGGGNSNGSYGSANNLAVGGYTAPTGGASMGRSQSWAGGMQQAPLPPQPHYGGFGQQQGQGQGHSGMDETGGARTGGGVGSVGYGGSSAMGGSNAGGYSNGGGLYRGVGGGQQPPQPPQQQQQQHGAADSYYQIQQQRMLQQQQQQQQQYGGGNYYG